MVWRTILIDAWVEVPLLRAAVAAALGLDDGDVAVVDDPTDVLVVPESTRVLVERTRQQRAFPSQLLVILRDPLLEQRLRGFPPTLAAVTDVARHLGRTVLVDDGPIEPWEMVRIRPDGAVDVVAVEWEQMGDVDSAVVIRDRPLHEVARESAARTA